MLSGDKIGPIDHVAVSGHPSAIAAIGGFMNDRGDRGRIGAAILGVAGPVNVGVALITNSNWVADAAELHAAFGLRVRKPHQRLRSYRLGTAAPEHGTMSGRSGTGRALPAEPMVVVGPGTGLGMAALVRRGSNITVIATEGGTCDASRHDADARMPSLRICADGLATSQPSAPFRDPGLENLYTKPLRQSITPSFRAGAHGDHPHRARSAAARPAGQRSICSAACWARSREISR